MGIYLGQLPSTELARLKAELAETLIANFCYPRFFDYRTGSLRMRPVDRAKRQDVWLYLSSIDFTSWNRIDLLSPDFQRHVERLFIFFVQRNRAFFGEQGRKRMTDVRMLITASSLAVTEGLRRHLTSRQSTNPPFGSPRPVTSWAMMNVAGYTEPKWEQIASSTTLLQQQLQEVRGETKASSPVDAHPAMVPARRVNRNRSSANGSDTTQVESEVRAVQPVQHTPPAQPVQTPLPGPLPQLPPSPQPSQVNLPQPVLVNNTETRSRPEAGTGAPVAGSQAAHALSPARESNSAAPPAPVTLPVPREQPVLVPDSVEDKTDRITVRPNGSASHVSRNDNVVESMNIIVGDEDVVIFEQLRHQLFTWLRIEALHAGMDTPGQGPTQLLESLRQQDDFDGTRLQVISTLLTIADQVISEGHATVLEYKQAMMFYLMHTRRSR